MSGLPEAEAVCSDEMGQDKKTFSDLCEEHFTTTPSSAKSGCCQLGKCNNRGQPRKLLVNLTSKVSAATILREASKLRMSHNPEFHKCPYINPDLSPGELQLAYERRQHKHEHKVLRNAAAGDHSTKSTNITSCDTEDAHEAHSSSYITHDTSQSGHNQSSADTAESSRDCNAKQCNDVESAHSAAATTDTAESSRDCNAKQCNDLESAHSAAATTDTAECSRDCNATVSYTHLTLPTKRIV